MKKRKLAKLKAQAQGEKISYDSYDMSNIIGFLLDHLLSINYVAAWNNIFLAVEESSSDDDSDEESEKAAATGEGGAEGQEAPNYRSGYGSGDEKK